MGRPTDTERGARMAYQAAVEALAGLPLFPDLVMTGDLAGIWLDIQFAAAAELEDQRMARVVLRG